MSTYSDRFTVVIDACVLVGVLERNILLSLAEEGLYRPRWTEIILDETERALASIFSKRGISTPRDTAAKQRANIAKPFPEAVVEDFEGLISVLDLPDPNDKHVLAAAIKADASVIVTENIRDFPGDNLRPYDIEAQTCDDFLANVISLDEITAMQAIRTMRERFQQPAIDATELILRAEQKALFETASLFEKYRNFI